MTRLDALIAAIERQEGFPQPGTLPARLNNPGDLIFAHQRNATPYQVTGADGKVRVFACFPTLADGIHALKVQIALDAQEKRHETLAIFIGHYAPPSDGNNTSAYLAGVMKDLGITDSWILLADVIDPEHDDPEVALLEKSILPHS